MKKLAILGASGHGKVVADAALMSGWDEVLFYDDAWPEISQLGPWKVVGNTSELLEHKERFDGAVVAIGNNVQRLEKLHTLEEAEIKLVTIIHPSAVISSFAEIGFATVVVAGAIVNPFAKIGHGCIINTGSTIDHDCVLADGVHVSPGVYLGGNVNVGRASWIGIGSCVRHSLTIGTNVIVGAGAAVINNIESYLIVTGVPACKMSSQKKCP